MSRPPVNEAGRLRVDKWLWHARFFKSRSLAASHCRARKVRLNGNHCSKASAMVTIGDILTFPKAGGVKVVEVLSLGFRRGPATEAALLYKDLTPEKETPGDQQSAVLRNPSREKGMGRPTKTERRALDRLMDRD